MPNTNYKKLADSVFNKIKDLNLAHLPDDIAYKIVMNYIQPACLQFKSCNQDLFDRDDDLEEFNFTLTNENFEILSNYMVISWLDSQILTTNNLKSRLTSSDFKSLNLPQQLSKLLELRTTLKKENDHIAIDRSYNKTDLFDMVKQRKKTKL